MANVFTEQDLPRGQMILVGRRLLDGQELGAMIYLDRPWTWEQTIRALQQALIHGQHVDTQKIQDILDR